MASLMPVIFAAGATGRWRIDRIDPVRGDGLPPAPYLDVLDRPSLQPPDVVIWTARGTTSNGRYTAAAEQERLAAVQPALGRPEATKAALIPIRKNAAWWDLAQDQRRAIFEEQSHHIATGLGYLPAVARRLYHCRDLGEPFDFLTWFEYAPANADSFEMLVRKLRQSQEWSFVEREVDIRVTRVDAA